MKALFIGLDGYRWYEDVRHPLLDVYRLPGDPPPEETLSLRAVDVPIFHGTVRDFSLVRYSDRSFEYREINNPPPAFKCDRCVSTHPHIHMPTWTEMVSAELRRREAARAISIEVDYPDENWPSG